MKKEIGEANTEENSERERGKKKKIRPGTVRAKLRKSRQHEVETEKTTWTSLPWRVTGSKAK